MKTGTFRWRIVALLFFSTTINYIDRQVIGILKPYIAKDLGWNEVHYGYIITAFTIAYALGLLVTGRLLDKFGSKIGYSAAIVVWSIAGIGHAFARSIVGFGMFRALLGFGESANFPAAVKTVAEWFPKKERALATSWFNSGTSIGAILAPIIVSFVTLKFGWRWAFIITGLFGFIWLLFWLPFYKSPENQKKLSKAEFDYIHSDSESESNEKIKWGSLFKYRQTTGICLLKLATDWVWWFYLYWIPDFLNKTQGIDIKDVVLPLIIIYTFASIGGIAGGWLSSHYIKSGKSINYSRKLTMLLFAVAALPVVFAAKTNNLWFAVLLVAWATAAHQGWSNNLFTLISDIYPKKMVGSMVGLSGFTGAIGGAVSAAIIGWMLQLTNSYVLVFSIAASMYLLAWLSMKVFIPNIKSIQMQKMD
jgi:ACS family hexuronate transporter-like MFS transporter